MKKKCAVSNESPENEDYVSNRNEDSVFIDVLLQATINGKPLSNEEILDETHTFMIAVNIFFVFVTLSRVWNVSKSFQITID